MRSHQLWLNPWITPVTARAFKLARLSRAHGWLHAAYIQTWKGELVVQLHIGGRKQSIGQTSDLVEYLRKNVRKDRHKLEQILSEFL